MLHNPTKKDSSYIIQSCAEISNVLGDLSWVKWTCMEIMQGVSFPHKSQYIININIVSKNNYCIVWLELKNGSCHLLSYGMLFNKVL